jgi:hypothetical protein
VEPEAIPAGAVGIDRLPEVEPVGDHDAVGGGIEFDDQVVVDRGSHRRLQPEQQGRRNGEP